VTIYLDHNATTPVAPSVTDAMLPYFGEHFGNPSSDHSVAQAPRAAIARARGQLAQLLGAGDEEMIFTSGGSEANNMALKGVMFQHPPASTHLVISNFEHPATIQPALFLERMGYQLTRVPVNAAGVVDPQQVADALRPTTRLVSIMHANNEIGTLQPIREIADLCHSRDVLVHSDAAQSMGKLAVKVDQLGVDMLSIAGHKMYAPKGVGALYLRSGLQLEPLIHGANHEGGRRAGTENTAYWVGLGEAARRAEQQLPQAGDQLGRLRDLLLELLESETGRQLSVNGAAADRLPNTLSVNFPEVIGSELLARTDQICASTGAACHSGETRLSDTLLAIGLDPEQARGTVRLSLGWSTSQDDVTTAARMLAAAWRELSSGNLSDSSQADDG
jgi:cysteine desulfurase